MCFHRELRAFLGSLLKNCWSNIDEVKGYSNDESDLNMLNVSILSVTNKMLKCNVRRKDEDTVPTQYYVRTSFIHNLQKHTI